MKKTFLALSTVSTLALCAQEYDPCCYEDICDPCREHLFVERSQLFIHTEFLYWAVEEGVLDYAVRMDQSTSADDTFAIGDYKVADFDWRPGYRVALSWYNCPHYWEVSGQYTWLYDKGSNTSFAPDDPDRFLNPTWQTITSGPFRKATSLIDVHYHVGDLFFARIFDPNPHLRMRLLGGLTTAYIQQSWKIRYSDFEGGFDHVKNKWRFFGGGIRLGTTVDWFWGCQFYFTGKVNFATLLGTYKNEARQITTDDVIVRDAEYDDHRFSFHAQFILGPSWQKPCECWSIELFAGYEFNIWLNLQEIIRSDLSPVPDAKESRHANGLFGTQGLTARLTLGF